MPTVTSVICRIDSQKRPVVFVADTLKNGNITAWTPGQEKPLPVPVDYYATTEPLSDADSQILADQFKEAQGEAHVFIRQRLPRVYKERPNLLTSDGSVNPPAKKGQRKGNRSAAAKAQFAADVAGTGGTAAASPAAVADPAVAALQKRLAEDPAFAAMAAKIMGALAASL
jgi:hypothetical protein